jgi:hypothetical protein
MLEAATALKELAKDESRHQRLSKAGWSWGCVSTINSNRQTIWIADAHHYVE